MTVMHRYESRLHWEGSTAAGYEAYEREHRVVVPPAATELRLSSDPAFHGDAELPNPEQLLVASASSCQLLMFLALAARSRVEVLEYEDHADAVMPADAQPMRITQITLRPRIVVAAGTNLDRVRRLVDRAHDGCFIANTINAAIEIEPTIEHGPQAVFSIWESRFPAEHVERGRDVTDAIWREMRGLPGYLRHVVVEDVEDPGHLFVVSEWESRKAADEVLVDYAGSPHARLANELAAEPRRRTVGRRV